MTDARKRIAELEEALGGINTHAQMGPLTAHEHKALNAYVQTALSLLPTLRAALSAMRPSVDAEKIAGIRARHESVADMADDEWDNRIYTIADDAFSDRAFLLSVIEGVNHDD